MTAPTSASEHYDFYDCHFHVWNVDDSDVHSATKLGLPSHTKYTCHDHVAAVQKIPFFVKGNERTVTLKGAVFVEAFAEDKIREIEYVESDAVTEKGLVDVRIVAGIDLRMEFEALATYLESVRGRIVGVRHVANYLPSWPDVDEDFLLGDSPSAKRYRENLIGLARKGLLPSVDLQCNPNQLRDSVETVWRHIPEHVPIVLNHLGLHKCCDDVTVWRDAMKAFATLPNAYVKLSMLWYGGDAAKTRALVQEALELFTPQRCMVGSNYPVDLAFAVSSAGEVAGPMSIISDVLESLSVEDRKQVLRNTAQRVYFSIDCSKLTP
eukprot:PhM_4_TR5895/c1_g1_i1/m.67468